MKKKVFIKVVGTFAMAFAIMLNSGILTWAGGSIGSGTVRVGYDCVMTQAETGLYRTTKNGGVLVKANSVYPVGNYDVDDYTKCWTMVYHHTIGNLPISAPVPLIEGEGYSEVEILDGYKQLHYFDLCFSGNHPDYQAYVSYSYMGT